MKTINAKELQDIKNNNIVIADILNYPKKVISQRHVGEMKETIDLSIPEDVMVHCVIDSHIQIIINCMTTPRILV